MVRVKRNREYDYHMPPYEKRQKLDNGRAKRIDIEEVNARAAAVQVLIRERGMNENDARALVDRLQY